MRHCNDPELTRSNGGNDVVLKEPGENTCALYSRQNIHLSKYKYTLYLSTNAQFNVRNVHDNQPNYKTKLIQLQIFLEINAR